MTTMHATQLLTLLLVSTLAFASAQNVSLELLKYPQFSTFASLMQETGVAAEAQTRSSLTILMPANDILDPYVADHPDYTTQTVADILRYHVLLQYFGGDELAQLSASGYILTTLYQTTGRANNYDGFVNLTKIADGTVTVGPSTPSTPPQANLITNITQFPYVYSFISISGVLQPLSLAQAVPVPVPATAPELAPVSSPVFAPELSPVESPVYSPMSSPVAPAAGPSADLPGAVAETSGAYKVGFKPFNAGGAAVVLLALVALLI